MLSDRYNVCHFELGLQIIPSLSTIWWKLGRRWRPLVRLFRWDLAPTMRFSGVECWRGFRGRNHRERLAISEIVIFNGYAKNEFTFVKCIFHDCISLVYAANISLFHDNTKLCDTKLCDTNLCDCKLVVIDSLSCVWYFLLFPNYLWGATFLGRYISGIAIQWCYVPLIVMTKTKPRSNRGKFPCPLVS